MIRSVMASLPLLLRNKTAANQAVGQQVGDPDRIANIGLPTGNIFDVSGIQTGSKSPSLRMFQTGTRVMVVT
jgi:hypothetical protein